MATSSSPAARKSRSVESFGCAAAAIGDCSAGANSGAAPCTIAK